MRAEEKARIDKDIRQLRLLYEMAVELTRSPAPAIRCTSVWMLSLARDLLSSMDPGFQDFHIVEYE